MTIRYNTDAKKRYGQAPLQSGYETGPGVPDIYIPPCGIEDVDVSMFSLFDKEIVAECGGTDGSEVRKVPVVFAAGEKWAMLKRGKLLRDKNNSLLIPLITIARTEVNQNITEDVVGRGINQQSGEIVVRRRLDKTDRNYQNLINKLMLPDQGATLAKNVGQLKNEKFVRDGAYLKTNLKNNVYETIVVPSPQFYTAKYQVTIWTQYTQHANQIIEKIFSTFLPQAQSWKLNTSKGYWFIAKVEEGSFSTENNFDDMSQQERYIKHTFNVNVPAYFFATSTPGSPIPIKRYVSSTLINFDVGETDLSSDTPEEPYILGSDDPTLPLDQQRNVRDDQRTPGWRPQKIYPISQDLNDPITYSEDPAVSTLPRGYIKEVARTSKGETVYTGAALDSLEIVTTK